MPSPIIKGFVEYLQAPSQLNIDVYDGELPRFDTVGDPITLSTAPAFAVEMTEQGMQRTRTFADPYSDEGPLQFYIFTNTRNATQALLNQLEGLLVNANNWPLIALPGGPSANPYYIQDIAWGNWTNILMPNIRDQNSNYIYLGHVICQITVHGAISTVQS